MIHLDPADRAMIKAKRDAIEAHKQICEWCRVYERRDSVHQDCHDGSLLLGRLEYEIRYAVNRMYEKVL